MSIKKPVINEATRAYIYRIALALFALAAIYGIIARDAIAGWVGIVTAVLGVGSNGLASKNTSTDPEKPKSISEAGYAGSLVIQKSESGPKVYSLELDGDPEELDQKKAVVFKVDSPPAEDVNL